MALQMLSKSRLLIFASTLCIKSENILDSVEQLSGITRNIELSGGSRYNKNLLRELVQIKHQHGLNFLIHGYFPPSKENFILNFADTGEKTRDFIRETMRFVRALEIDYCSIHAGFKRDFELEGELLINPKGKYYTLEGLCKNIEWFNREFPNTKLALENFYPNNMNKETCFFMHIDEIVEFLKMYKNTYLLLDLGHLKISAKLLGFDYLDAVNLLFEKYVSRILEIHLSENRGQYDDHELIYSDSIQYMAVKKYAYAIDNNRINVVIESRNSSIDALSKCFLIVKDAILCGQNKEVDHVRA